MIDTVLIPAAGMGTRLLTYTKESPKEMVPIFYKTPNNVLLLKPLLEKIFEDLYDEGFRKFCFIVGRGKETIENHLSPHYDFVDMLKKKGESEYAKILTAFYKKIEKSSIVWVRQYTPSGIGHATLLGQDVMGKEPFLFHAGDLYVTKTDYIRNMVKTHKKESPTATVGLIKRKNPTQFGVATLKKIGSGQHQITHVVEKPKKPLTNFALTGVNIFEPKIFDAIRKTNSGVNGEIQLTDSIQTLIQKKYTVMASIMKSKEQCIDIGTTSNYYKALSLSYK